MTQPNESYAPFNLTYEGHHLFDSHPPHLPNPAYPQWNQQNMRPMGPIPSSSPSQRTSVSGTSAAPLNGHGMNRSSQFQLESNGNIDPNLNPTLLAVPQLGRTRSPIDNSNGVSPLYDRVYGGIHDEPWSSVRMRNSSIPNGRSYYPQPDPSYTTYRDYPASDADSGAPRSDSGYYTHPARSVTGEPERQSQELPPEIYAVRKMNVGTPSSEPTEVYPLQSDQTSQYSGRSGSMAKAIFRCTTCSETAKCPSDYKKHMLKHEKPHVCDVNGCRRAAIGKGFTTKNDLDRHKKSVHRVGVEKGSYQCASEHCRNRGKIWPRLDNFKQHINRMHKDEDEHDLISRSVYQEPYPPTGESLSVAPLDTALAGIGTDKQFAGNDLDDPASAISLTLDQDSNRWASFDHTASGFASDVDLMSNVPTNANSIKTSQDVGSRHSDHARSPQPYTGNATRHGQDSLQVLVDAADIAASRPSLSSAPQTKVEQQIQAYRKPSRTFAGNIQTRKPTENPGLEDVVLQALYDATNQSTEVPTSDDSGHLDKPMPTNQDSPIIMTKAEALQASRNITELFKQSRRPQMSSTSRRSSKGSSPNKIQCSQCNVTVQRSCDLKKHMKRHTKPYGCTYPKCFKRFGAKSDWKRHENNQHYQQEAYLCHRPSSISSSNPPVISITPCRQLYYRQEQFRVHLINQHGVSDPQQLDTDLKERQIGMGNQRRFWCGFCKTIVPLKEKRNAAWDERFDHIDHHFSKEAKSIEDWICLEAGRTKSELRKEIYRRHLNDEDGEADDDDEDELDAEGVADDGSPVPVSPSFAAPAEAPAPIPEPFPSATPSFFDTTSFMPSSRKRQAPMDEPALDPMAKRRKTDWTRYCCSCQGGPWPVHTYVSCMTCEHHLCGSCIWSM